MNARMDAFEGRRSGRAGDLDRWLHARRDDWNAGERHLAYTLIACGAMILLGLIVVPLSIPDPAPKPSHAEVLGERFLNTIPVNDANRPTIADVTKAYGSTGGEACTGTLADAYGMLITKVGAGPRTAFSPAAHARMKLVHQTYCPERAAQFGEFVRTKTLANARARKKAIADREAAAAAGSYDR